MTYNVRLSRVARNDIAEIAVWIARNADPDAARAYADRIEASCRTLSDYPARGRAREEYGAGIRSLAFERRATIFYRLAGEQVIILHVVHHGRDADHVFDPGESK